MRPLPDWVHVTDGVSDLWNHPSPSAAFDQHHGDTTARSATANGLCLHSPNPSTGLTLCIGTVWSGRRRAAERGMEGVQEALRQRRERCRSRIL